MTQQEFEITAKEMRVFLFFLVKRVGESNYSAALTSKAIDA